MRFRTPRTPADVLWRELEEWFREEDATSHAGPDVMFYELDAVDVDRVWRFLRSSADPIDPTRTTWDEVDDAEVSVVTVLERGPVAAAARCPNLLVGITGVIAHGVKLPWLGVFIYTDAVAFYWWVSDDEGWNAETVAALAKLIDDLRRLAPAARVEVEWDPQGTEFLRDRSLPLGKRSGWSLTPRRP